MRIALLIGCCALLGALTSTAPPPAAPVAVPTTYEVAQPTVRPVAVRAEAATSSPLAFRYSLDGEYDEAVLCQATPLLVGATPQALPPARVTVGQVWPAPAPPLVADRRMRASIKFKQPPCSYRRAILPV